MIVFSYCRRVQDYLDGQKPLRTISLAGYRLEKSVSAYYHDALSNLGSNLGTVGRLYIAVLLLVT